MTRLALTLIATLVGTTPFSAASGDTAAAAECRTSDITLAALQTLSPKMDAANVAATTA